MWMDDSILSCSVVAVAMWMDAGILLCSVRGFPLTSLSFPCHYCSIAVQALSSARFVTLHCHNLILPALTGTCVFTMITESIIVTTGFTITSPSRVAFSHAPSWSTSPLSMSSRPDNDSHQPHVHAKNHRHGLHSYRFVAFRSSRTCCQPGEYHDAATYVAPQIATCSPA